MFDLGKAYITSLSVIAIMEFFNVHVININVNKYI
jgi:hypothetical protein